MPALRICCRICYPSGMLMRACVAGLLLLLCGTFALAQVHPRDQEPPTIRAEVALVNVIFTAVDKNGRHVPDLKTGDFMVFEDRIPQKVEYFSELGKGTDVPLTIALLIDTSGSVKSKLAYEKETAAEFFREVLRKGKDLALIIQFDSDVNLVQDFTDDPTRLINSLDSLEAGNSTALYDAIFLAADEKLKDETGRKIIVVITDRAESLEPPQGQGCHRSGTEERYSDLRHRRAQ